MPTTNFLIRFLEWSHIDPHGVLTASVGGLLSLLFLEGDQFSFRRLLATWLACWGLGGYSAGVIGGYISDRAAAALANAGVGFLIMDLLNSLKTQAPTLTATVVKAAGRMVGRLLGTSPTKPPKNDV